MVVGGVIISIIGGVLFIMVRRRRARARLEAFRRDMMIRTPGILPSFDRYTTATPTYRNQTDSPIAEKLSQRPTSDRSTADSKYMYRDHRSSLTTVETEMDVESSIQFSSQTERQMDLDDKIEELQERIEQLESSPDGDTRSGDDLRVWKLKGQVEQLASLKGSPWALGLTNETPAGFHT